MSTVMLVAVCEGLWVPTVSPQAAEKLLWVPVWVLGLLVGLEEHLEVLRGDLQEVRDARGDIWR